MKRTYWTLSLLFALSLLMTMSCSGEDPIKAKRIAIENGTYKPKPKPTPNPEPNPNPNPDPNPNPNPNPDPNPNPNPEPNPNPNPNPEPKPEKKTQEITFTFDEWASPRAEASYLMPVEKSLPNVLAEDPFWEAVSNVGAAWVGISKPEGYPIHPLTKGRTGQALEAMTIKGKRVFGLGSHIIAGALYSGLFAKDLMMSKPIECTQFGQPVFAIPLSIKGYYQWLPGEKLIDGSKIIAREIKGEQDQATIACVFYDISQDDSYLNGKTLYTDSRILAKVQLHPTPTKDGTWTPFESKLEIVNEAAYKQIDFQKGKYRMVLIFSSSADGDKFRGAIGSRLRIDDFTVTLGIPTQK